MGTSLGVIRKLKLHDTIIDTDSKQLFDIPLTEDQLESTQMGTPSFPLEVFHDDLRKNVLGYVNWHWNRELQFCRVVGGTVVFSVAGEHFTTHTGDGIFINAGVLHMSKPLPGENGIYTCVMADASLLRGFTGSVFDTRYVTPYLSSPSLDYAFLSMQVPWQARILEQITEISNLQYMREYGYELDILSRLTSIWSLILTNIRPDEIAHKKRTRSDIAVNKILTYLGNHYSERILIEDIARAVSYSPGECCRIFKKELGVTISQFLNAHRVERSVELLSGTDMSIAEIAYDTGFSSTSYYIKYFRELTGMTPLHYRKALSER